KADDDGNGFVDDVHGWDFVHGDNGVYDGGSSGTEDSHGTHIAGIIGAVEGNGEGVVGINWRVSLIPVKVIGTTGPEHKIIRGIQYLIDLKRSGVNVVAINASWGGRFYDLALLEEIKEAARENILFIAAAGNDDGMDRNNDDNHFYPASFSTMEDT